MLHQLSMRIYCYALPHVSTKRRASSITGSLTGTNRRSVSYTAAIQQPLVKKFTLGCARHFISGTIQIANSNGRSLLLNYDPTGTAACDNIASVTINGTTHTITLR